MPLAVRSSQEVAPRLRKQVPDVRRERPRHFDAKCVDVQTPEYDLRLAEQRACTHANRKSREMQVESAKCVDRPGGTRTGHNKASDRMRNINDARGWLSHWQFSVLIGNDQPFVWPKPQCGTVFGPIAAARCGRERNTQRLASCGYRVRRSAHGKPCQRRNKRKSHRYAVRR